MKANSVKLSLAALTAALLTGCFDRDCSAEVKGARTSQGLRLNPDEHDVAWEFRLADPLHGHAACRPGNIFSDLGLNYWTTLYLVGQADDVKILSGIRGGKEISLVVRESGQAHLLEQRDLGVAVYEFGYSYKFSLRKDGRGNPERYHAPTGNSFFFAKLYAEN